LPGGGKDDIDVNACAGQHIDQSIDAKEIDPATNKVTDSGLCDTEELGCFPLGEAAVLDEFAYCDHQCRTDSKVLSLIFVKAKISEYVPAGWSDFRVHG
jgi:hypothetical protein